MLDGYGVLDSCKDKGFVDRLNSMVPKDLEQGGSCSVGVVVSRHSYPLVDDTELVHPSLPFREDMGTLSVVSHAEKRWVSTVVRMKDDGACQLGVASSHDAGLDNHVPACRALDRHLGQSRHDAALMGHREAFHGRAKSHVNAACLRLASGYGVPSYVQGIGWTSFLVDPCSGLEAVVTFSDYDGIRANVL